MKALMPLAAFLACLDGVSTDYTAQRTLRVSTEAALELELFAFTMERDGKPAGRTEGGGMASETRTVEETFRVLDAPSADLGRGRGIKAPIGVTARRPPA